MNYPEISLSPVSSCPFPRRDRWAWWMKRSQEPVIAVASMASRASMATSANLYHSILILILILIYLILIYNDMYIYIYNDIYIYMNVSWYCMIQTNVTFMDDVSNGWWCLQWMVMSPMDYGEFIWIEYQSSYSCSTTLWSLW